MGFRILDIAVAVLLNVIHNAYADNILSCNTTDPFSCPGANMICNGTSLRCYCDTGFVLVNKECEVPSPGGHSAAAAVVAIFTLALLICGAYLVERKFKVIDYVRQRFTQRRNNDIMYEDVMIGQDDPPLTP